VEDVPNGSRSRGAVQKPVFAAELRLQEHAGPAGEGDRLLAELEASRSHLPIEYPMDTPETAVQVVTDLGNDVEVGFSRPFPVTSSGAHGLRSPQILPKTLLLYSPS
jgi:hypothetical protein